MRHIIVHYHIYKNAGSTIDSILKYSFGKRFGFGQHFGFGERCGSIEGSNPWDTLNSDDVLKYAIDNPHIKVISSHQARLPVPSHTNLEFHPILFLRHPIDRAGSVYSFERRQPVNSSGPGVKIARENDFAGYVKWRLSEGNGAVIRNFQTVHLSGRQNDMRVATATENDLRDALVTISQLPFFGIVELFDDSIEKMRKYLSQYFKKIDIKYSVANRSSERKNTLHERLDDMKKMLGADLYQDLLDKNALDMRLYEHALRLFSSNNIEQISSIQKASRN